MLEQVVDEVDEIILVDGDSTDVTLVTARRNRPDVRVVAQQGTGKGSALRTGFQAATGDIIVMMDADGSMSPSEIPHYVHFLANGYDFVKGSRFISGGSSLDITWFRSLGNRFLLTVFNSLYRGHLTDLCYGFCAFDRRYLEHLHLSATGFEIEAEMTVRAMQAGLRIAEVPSLELPRRSGESNLMRSATVSASCEPCCAITARVFPGTSTRRCDRLPGDRPACRRRRQHDEHITVSLPAARLLPAG